MTRVLTAPSVVPADPARPPTSLVPAFGEAYRALYVNLAGASTLKSLFHTWVTPEPGAEVVLTVGYDPLVIPREVVDYLIHRRYGVPAEVIEVTL